LYKLLIVDDEREIRNGLCNYFPWGEIGFEVKGQCENGKQALEFLKENSIDVVLCDIKMPVMTGIDLARELHGLKNRIKIVFLSGYKEFEYAQKALIYNVRNYIIKPAKYSELVDVFTKIKAELDEEASDEMKSLSISCTTEDVKANTNYHDIIITNVKTFIKENYRDVTLEKAASLVHMNPYYLSNFFKQKTGENFSDFVIKAKMEKAAELLGDINYKIHDISDSVGYSSAKNFTRAFKAHFNKSPREYRNSSL